MNSCNNIFFPIILKHSIFFFSIEFFKSWNNFTDNVKNITFYRLHFRDKNLI